MSDVIMWDWDYRVVEKTLENGEVQFAIHTCFYKDGKIMGVSDDPSYPYGEDRTKLMVSLNHYNHAVNKPILIYEDIEK